MTIGRLPTARLALVVPLLAVIAMVGTRAVKGSATTTVATSRGSTVLIKNFAFHPATLTVDRGSKVRVSNGDGTAHTLSARNNGFSTPVLGAGKTATISLDTAGTFAVYCKIHATMKGTVVVK